MVYFLLWWIIVEIIGWLALPIALRVLRWLPDRGYIFSKSIGLLVASYILWLGASTHILSNDMGGILAAILIMAGISTAFYLYTKGKNNETSLSFLKENKKLVLSVEILFAVSFAAWAILRAYAPDKIMNAGGEKFMEIAFLNAILNSRFFPPLDPWLSGFAISYYYYGYVMMAFLTRLSGAPAGIGFDLYDSLLFALTVVGAFGVVYNLVSAASARKTQQASAPPGSQALGFGLLGGLLVAIMGNLEGFLEVLYSAKALPEAFWKWINIPDLAAFPATGKWIPPGYWWQVWWHASRILQDLNLDNNPAPVSPITEFPSFSFILGDNHPHVLALPFVLLAVALALAVLLKTKDLEAECPRLPIPDQTDQDPTSSSQPKFLGLPRKMLLPFDSDWVLFTFSALVLGSLTFLNTWDFPIYLGVLLLAYIAGQALRQNGFTFDILIQAAVLAIELLAASILLYIFFYVGFGSQAGGILPYVLPPTRLPQYLVMFGTFIFILFSFLGVYALAQRQPADEKKAVLKSFLSTWGWTILVCALVFGIILLAVSLSGFGRQLISGQPVDSSIQSLLGEGSFGQILTNILLARLLDPWLLLVLSALIALTILSTLKALQNTAEVDAFVFILIFVGVVLTLSVEFFYLRDSFGLRMNTVFKFYYQGWVMLGLASAYGLWWLANASQNVLSKAARSVILTFAGLLILAGMVYPVLSGLNRVQNFTGEPNLDGASGIAASNPEDWAAIQWLLKNAPSEDATPPVILEAPGGSYNYEGRISAFTGFPAVLGWAVHESQWRGSYEEQGKREPDIATIYTTSDSNLTRELLKKWNVDYVILGPTEHSFIQRLCLDQSRRCSLATVLRNFDQTLTPVFNQGLMTIYQVP
jgi:YYY domain-containing protein